ncbi:hypothetical protein [Streptomyces sp. NPDC057287]|uniref:hypothetical protein n=1 Tax=Streptomyces sp. NPDC057287 TaxID=3346086 RepID=UPI00363CFDFA
MTHTPAEPRTRGLQDRLWAAVTDRNEHPATAVALGALGTELKDFPRSTRLLDRAHLVPDALLATAGHHPRSPG